MNKKRYALISVYDKNKIEILCKLFKDNNISVISTGNTYQYIKNNGYKCLKVEKFTKFKEILDGRVKTLHPKLHASLLFCRNKTSHIKEFNSLKFPKIDFVIVNLYPFEKIQEKNINHYKHVEMIDIGGASMLRSAAKNFESITTICNIDDYKSLSSQLNKNNGKTSLQFRKKMASKVFELTSSYDFNIFNWLNNNKSPKIKIYNHSKQILRYGENPHQKAIYFKQSNKKTINDGIIQSNKLLSYNNLLDIDAAFDCINEFTEPSCVIIKHSNPCGVASNKQIIDAYKCALKTDPISAFGGILALNKTISKKLAKLISLKFFEIIIAPSFNQEAKKIFSKKKKLILIETKNINKTKNKEIKRIVGGYLYQQKNVINFSKKHLKLVSKRNISMKLVDDIIFAFKVCKHVKSNAIVLAKNKAVIGIGAGQMSRIDATKLSLKKTSLKQKKAGFVAASDAFFPFTDNIKLLMKNNCKAIIQPSGSINDLNIINFAIKNKIPLYFSPFRFFKH